MGSTPKRIGFVGLKPKHGWGTRAHLPALKGLPDDFEVVGVANSTAESSRAAAHSLGLPRAFDSVAELIASPDVDVVAVTVKVPFHHQIVSEVLAAGKHVYCEWPLGNGLEEARDLAAKARESGVLAVIGTQALFAPEVSHLRELLHQGYVGRVLSTSVTGVGGTWGATMPSSSAYTLDRTQGANLLTIPVGHTLAAITKCLGQISEISASLATRRETVRIAETDEIRAVTSPDQVLANGLIENGIPFSLHYRGGDARGDGFIWEINGTDGDIRLTGDRGQSQLVQLSLNGGQGDRPFENIPLPAHLAGDTSDGPIAGNVRRLYAAMAQDLRHRTKLAPTFDDAILLHQIVTAIETSAAIGQRIRPELM